jgi:valyl-tRNA synthetase
MICSYGDRFDLDAINRHKLKPKPIISKDGKINSGEYFGMKVIDARKKILEDLENEGLISEIKEMNHAVNVHDKCGTAIEFVNTPQWFIRIMDKKKELIAQGNKINWYPEFMHKRYDNWVNGLEWDWSISRNRHFGIPIPAWECESCKKIIVAGEKDLPVDPLQTEMKCKCGEVATPEKMVLDTWATSSVTPQIAADLVDKKVKIPFSLRPQGHDIIRTWAFYTIVKAYLNEGEIPWKDIVISGTVSLGGEKMSKSKGNVINPQEVIKKYSADSLRYWAAGSKLGQDLDYQEKDLVTGKKLVNKILNATNFVFMNLEGYDGKKKPKKLEEVDQIFLTKVGFLVESVTEHFEKYEYSRAKQEIDEFFWSTFCDNYLEIVKKRVYQGEGDRKLSAQYALYNGLYVLLKLWAPIVPFITEEVYQNHFKKFEGDKSIHLSSWPVPEFNSKKELGLLYLWGEFILILDDVRKIKSQEKKAMNSEIKLTLTKESINVIKDMLEDLKNVTGAVEVKEGKEFKVDFVLEERK